MPRKNFRELEARMGRERIEASNARVKKMLAEIPLNRLREARHSFVKQASEIRSLAGFRQWFYRGAVASMARFLRSGYRTGAGGKGMKYQGYEGKVEFDDDAAIFHGEVINTRDVITFSGQLGQGAAKGF